MSQITLIHGDSMIHERRKIRANIVITDMPYGTTNCRWDTPISLPDFWALSDCVCAGRVVAFGQTPFDKVLGASNIKNLRYELIWEKTEATGHLNAKRCPMKAHENILVFGQTPYYPQKTFGHKRKSATAERSRLQSDCYGEQKGITRYDSTERYPRSVIKFSTDKQKLKLHPTQKPIALMEYLILQHTKKGDIVFDPFMGSGTTGLACKNLERHFIGIEKDTEYFKAAQKRLNS